jgi:hypothetical protein
MADENLEQKIRQSLKEGYTREEILEIMKQQGYSHHEIGKALAIIKSQ